MKKKFLLSQYLLLLMLWVALAMSSCNSNSQPINFKESLLLDVRTSEEFNEGSIENAINIPVDELESRIGEIKNDKPIVVFCRSGNRSARAKKILEEKGFENVINGGGVGDLQVQFDQKKD
jgi:phage shock protein E